MDYTTVAFCSQDEKHGKIALIIRNSSAIAWSFTKFDNSDLCYTVQDCSWGEVYFCSFLLNSDR